MAGETQERGRMREEDELCLQKYILEIEKTIEAKELTGGMFVRNIIDLDDMDAIQSVDTRIERARRFLNIIRMRGPKAFQAFVESLDSKGYRDLAAKLKGSRTTTGELTASLKDSHGANSLSVDLSTLRRRIDDIEQTREVYFGALRSEVKGELHNLSSTLIKIEELSRANEETETAINSLQKQLKEKDQLLSAANEQMKATESEISKLESRMDQQEKDQITLHLSTTGKWTASLNDSHGANSLSVDLSTLRHRVDAIEQNTAVDVDLGEVKGELISSTLINIEEHSRVSRETENTIQKQLEEKARFLSAAKEQIKALESKVSKLESENATLIGRLEEHEKQIHDLKMEMEENKQDADAQRDQDKKEREQDRKETKDTFTQTEHDAKETKDQDQQKGSRTTTGELTASIKCSHCTNNLTEDVSTLRRRVDAMEQARAMDEDRGAKGSEAKREHNLSSILIKIEELSKLSMETANTINYLQKQLKEKDQLVDVAKDQIKALELKVLRQESKNAILLYRINQQNKQLRNITTQMKKRKRAR